MEKLKSIFVVKVFEKLQIDELGCADVGCCRRWGSFQEFNDAEYCVVNNVTDIWETCYDYALIAEEEFNCVCASNKKEWYYKYDKKTDKYLLIDKPIELKYFMM